MKAIFFSVVRRRSNFGVLGALFILYGCSGESFTTAQPKPDSGAAGHGAATGGSSGSGGAPTGGSSQGGTGSGAGGVQASGGSMAIEAGATTGGTGTGVEAGLVEASRPSTWCDHQTALFCEDFDRFADVDKFLGSWTTYSISGGEFSFARDSSTPSPPNALRVRTTATSNVKTLIAQNLPAFGSLPNRLRMEFTLRINKAVNIGALQGVAFAGFFNGPEITDGAVAMAIAMPLVGSVPELEIAYIEPARDGGVGFNAKASQNPFPPLNQWVGRYALDIQYTTNSTDRSGCAHLSAGGIDQLGGCLTLPASLASPKTITVVLGAYSTGLFGNNSGDVEVEYDNLVVTSQ